MIGDPHTVIGNEVVECVPILHSTHNERKNIPRYLESDFTHCEQMHCYASLPAGAKRHTKGNIANAELINSICARGLSTYSSNERYEEFDSMVHKRHDA